MAFPLKSGADLYNQQLIRAAIWNYSAEIIDPKEYATGLMYFNTNPGSNLYQKLRFRTGTEWKTIAFEEDLDMANNADFKALEDKVKLLSGEVDTDAIISNMKEVSNFLAGFAEDANLMSVLDGKLDKSGGTIRGSVIISGNGESVAPLNIITPSMGYKGYIRFGAASTANEMGLLGFSAKGVPSMMYEGSEYPLLHSGNVGEYNAGGLVGQYVADLNNATANKIFSSGFQAANIPSENYATGWTLYNDELKYTYQLAYNSSGKLYSRYKTSAWSDWKTIAFTDSNVASAQALVHSNGTIGAVVNSSGNVLIGATEDKGQKLQVGGTGLFTDNLTTYGNLEFGIYGAQITSDIHSTFRTSVFGRPGDFAAIRTFRTNNDSYFGDSWAYSASLAWSSGDTHAAIAVSYNANQPKVIVSGGNADALNWTAKLFHSKMALEPDNNETYNIGSSSYRWGTLYAKKGDFSGDVVANGTIACKGIAAEGDAMDMVDKTVLYIIPNGTQQTFTLNHGLGTREIAISIYEITSMGTNMILTDVEITGDNTISVSFGNPPTENHMVVVMG